MNPPHPKIIFFDIDETLYSHRLQCVPPSAQAALHALKRQGIAANIIQSDTQGFDALDDLNAAKKAACTQKGTL